MSALPSSEPKLAIKDFIYVDEPMIDRYVAQIHELVAEFTKTDYEASISITGPSLKASKKKEKVPLKTDQKLSVLECFLRADGDLADSTPLKMPEYDNTKAPRFVVETMTATKVLLPIIESPYLQGLKNATLWISDPDPSLYVREDFDWRGSFLYLAEFRWESGHNSFLSGVSALQLLANIAQGKDFWSIVNEEYEPFGRGRDLHPVDKLKDIGAVAVGRRRIRSLYKIRYFTNEQVYRFEGEKRRVNDLFGYPLYIVDES